MIQIIAPRILIKRAITDCLSSYSASQEEALQFAVYQDFMGQLPPQVWDQSPRMVNVFLESFTNDGSFTDMQETATYTIVSAVSPPSNDYTQGVDGLNFLLDQVRAAIWGDGDTIGLRHYLPDNISLASHNAFNATMGTSFTDDKERLILYAETNLEIIHNTSEYSDFEEKHASGVEFKGDYND